MLLNGILYSLVDKFHYFSKLRRRPSSRSHSGDTLAACGPREEETFHMMPAHHQGMGGTHFGGSERPGMQVGCSSVQPIAVGDAM